MRLNLMIFVLLFTLGCARNDASISIDSSNQQVVLSNATLAENLKLGNAKTKKLNGRLMASVKVTNNTQDTQHLQYRFYWYDGSGLELNVEQSPWQTLIIYGGDSSRLQGIAIDPEAENFRVSIRSTK